MKKKITTILCLATFVLLSPACKKSFLEESDPNAVTNHSAAAIISAKAVTYGQTSAQTIPGRMITSLTLENHFNSTTSP
jgi:hypothetical protein